MPALALTDTNNLFGALEFSETLRRGRHPADHRLHALAHLRGRARDGGAGAASSTERVADGRIALLAKDAARLRQSHAAFDRGLFRRQRDAARLVTSIADLARAGRGPHRADRRP